MAAVAVAAASIASAAVAGGAVVGGRANAEPVTLGCDDGARHALPTGHLVNNMWNHARAGPGAWRQCLQSRVRDGRTEFGWSWQWPERDALYAYPSLVVGRSPWLAVPSNDARFPRSIENTRRLLIDYEVESMHRGKRNLAVEFWVTDTASVAARPEPSKIKAELMIWTDASSGMVSATDKPEATVEIDGATWRVYVHRHWGDLSGGSTRRWTLISYHATRPSLSARYDARRFFQDAVDRGLLSPSDHIADLEFGNEIASGSGATWIRKFELTVE